MSGKMEDGNPNLKKNQEIAEKEEGCRTVQCRKWTADFSDTSVTLLLLPLVQLDGASIAVSALEEKQTPPPRRITSSVCFRRFLLHIRGSSKETPGERKLDVRVSLLLLFSRRKRQQVPEAKRKGEKYSPLPCFSVWALFARSASTSNLHDVRTRTSHDVAR